MSISSESLKHTRQIYGLLDIFGDFGGLLDFLSLIIGVIFAPWSEFKFLTKAIEKLYLVRTRSRFVFRKSEADKHNNRLSHIKSTAKAYNDNASQIRIGKLSVCASLQLFIKENFCCCLFWCVDEPQKLSDRTQRWYRLGTERLEKELDVIKLIRHLRDLRVLTKEMRHEDDLKYRLTVMGKNVLNIDSDASDEEDPELDSPRKTQQSE